MKPHLAVALSGVASAIALSAGLLAAPSSARADTIQIPGAVFARKCPCDIDAAPGSVAAGALSVDGKSTYFAPLPPTSGKVCRMSMLYRDVNGAETLTARLFRKPVQVGSAIDAAPKKMASVKSANGVVETVRRATTTDVASPSLDASKNFYFVEVDFDNVNMDLVGVQIEVEKTCS